MGCRVEQQPEGRAAPDSDCARDTRISRAGFRRGLESEHFRHSLGEIVLSHRGVDLNGGHFQTCRFLAEDVREHPIALK